MHSFPLKTMVLPGRESKIGREKKWSFRARKYPKYPPSVLHLSKMSIYFPLNKIVFEIIFNPIPKNECSPSRKENYFMFIFLILLCSVFYNTVKSHGQTERIFSCQNRFWELAFLFIFAGALFRPKQERK